MRRLLPTDKEEDDFRSSRAFVPPEPSAGPPRLDWRYVPRWVPIVAVIGFLAIAAALAYFFR